MTALAALVTLELEPCRSEQLDADVVTTRALLYFLFDLAETTRTKDKATFALHHLRKCSVLAVGRLAQVGGGFCYLTDDNRAMQLQGSGVCNLKQFMHDSKIHRNVVLMQEKLWNEMKVDEEVCISSEFTAASLMDITTFLASCVKFKRTKGLHAMSPNALDLRNEMRKALVRFLAACLDTVVHQAIQHADILSRQIPSRGKKRRADDQSAAMVVPGTDHDEPHSQRGAQRKARVSVDVGTIWEWLQHASEIKLSLPVYLQTKEKDREGGSHPQTCQMWLGKLHNMYQARSSLSFRDVLHINICADASRFSGRDTLISAAYSPENDVGVYLNNQFLRSGKLIGPGDLLLEDTVEVLAAQRKTLRMAAYGMIQALSNQIKMLTQGRMTIQSFDYENTPLALAAKPLSPAQLRLLTTNPATGQVEVFLREKSSGEMRKIDLSACDELKVLSLRLDQGSSGTAMASFLGGTNPSSAHMVNVSYDPYHRCSRDMTLAMGVPTAPRHASRIKMNLQRAHLSSSYLWTLNYKPYGQAAVFQAKMELLENFVATQDEDWDGVIVFPERVSPLRLSLWYRSRGWCLIRVLTIFCGILLVKFHMNQAALV